MNSRYSIELIGTLTVVTFDVMAALLSRSSGIRYSKAAIISVIIYCVFGYLAARSTPATWIQVAARTGALLGVVDATLGWAVSWLIGPGRLKSELSFGRWLLTCAFVAIIALACATVGGLIARVNIRSAAGR